MRGMEIDGSKLRKLQEELDVNTMDVAVTADLHPQTIYRVYNNDPTVSRNTVKRVRKALSHLQEKLTPSNSKSAG